MYILSLLLSILHCYLKQMFVEDVFLKITLEVLPLQIGERGGLVFKNTTMASKLTIELNFDTVTLTD